MNQTNNRIREEWKVKFRKLWSSFNKDNEHLTSEEMEDFIAELLKSQREELVKKIEKHQNFITMSDYDVGYNDCKENIINLIKNN